LRIIFSFRHFLECFVALTFVDPEVCSEVLPAERGMVLIVEELALFVAGFAVVPA
jgi:hypothetical protein